MVRINIKGNAMIFILAVPKCIHKIPTSTNQKER